MGKLDELSRRVPSAAKAVAGIALAWGAMLGLPSLCGRLAALVSGIALSQGWVQGGVDASAMHELIATTTHLVGPTLMQLVIGLTFAVPLGMLGRMVARGRIRAGLPDPLDRARDWTAAHPHATRALRVLPAAWWLWAEAQAAYQFFFWRWALYLGFYKMTGPWPSLRGMTDGEIFRHACETYPGWTAGIVCTMAATAGLLYKATGPALGAFLAPTVDAREKEDARAPTSDRRVAFDAVAVTVETRAAVAAMAALPVLTFFAMRGARLGGTGTDVALAAYVSVAIGGALAFRRASRIAVGIDGIFVTGTSRSRFFAYRDLDAVRTRGSDIEVLRRDRVVLRLQLHGDDATQRDAIVARIQEAADTAKQQRTATVGEIVATASDEKLARLGEGGAEGYRSASVTKEQLWSLVGAPEADAQVRTAAARALVKSGDDKERARLRVTANECAQPAVRVALMELAGDEDDDDHGDSAPIAQRRSAR